MLTARIEKIRQNYVNAKSQISCERAALWTESYKRSAGKPVCIRSADKSTAFRVGAAGAFVVESIIHNQGRQPNNRHAPKATSTKQASSGNDSSLPFPKPRK